MKMLILGLLLFNIVPFLALAQTTPLMNASVENFITQPAKDPVLYDQMDFAHFSGLPSQTFETIFQCYNSAGADDFDVPQGITWNITGVTVGCFEDFGSGFPDPVTCNITFYNDNQGIPGTINTSFTGLSILKTNLFGGTIALPGTVTLAEGKYWLSVVVDEDYDPYGQFYLIDRYIQTGAQAAWINPGDCFTLGASNWTAIHDLDFGFGYDFLFRLYGFEGEANSSVPVSNWALFLGVGLILVFSLFRFWRIER